MSSSLSENGINNSQNSLDPNSIDSPIKIISETQQHAVYQCISL